ncbi:hypothetical protein Acsp06_56640 [Actinomycetospora sp. NBRC 106375]|uniref:hypothetical protein n=1 Tax=Actinomycetospora sp. NBRC 106375 TaxID=3032207 RepID=UPI0024A3A6F3|nr:hypothetical protein [Actinomycetospora sp. NBRC 106375]GLZ49479.1 hypothetical protein Acsp06_56640 [Actinomycetospora sp. NBRC 106375]
MEDDRYVDLESAARLLDTKGRKIRRALRRGHFPEPDNNNGDELYWLRSKLLRWAMRSDPTRYARTTPLPLWPTPDRPADYSGTTLSKDKSGPIVVQRWQTQFGVVAVLWRLNDPIMLHALDVEHDVKDAVLLVQVDPGLGFDGPDASAINPKGDREKYDIAWRDLVVAIGQPAPFWPLALRVAELITTWQPGDRPVEWPARVDLTIEPLLEAAMAYRPSHPTHRCLINLVQVDYGCSTKSTLDELEQLEEVLARAHAATDPDTAPSNRLAVAARPLPVAEIDEDLPEADERAGWLELLGRSDPLANQCVREVLTWNGGGRFPYSRSVEIDVASEAATQWINRLQPIRRTAGFCVLDMQTGYEIIGTLIDPLTDAPAGRNVDGQVFAATPQRLPTASSLAAIELGGKNNVWVYTEDGNVYPAPERSHGGYGWGYGGTGAMHLGWLMDALLDDITAAGAGLSSSGHTVPEGLKSLVRQPWPSGTKFDRSQLQAAREGRPPSLS